MRVLIVAATEFEIAPFLSGMGPGATRPYDIRRHTFSGHDVDVVTTGIGMVATAAKAARALCLMHYDLALNVGVCGSFDPALGVGQVVRVASDRIAELGAEDGEIFRTADELDLVALTWLESPPVPVTARELGRLPSVRGITVNTVHGNEQSIAAVKDRFHPQVESMEGAAFMYTCMIQPELKHFAQVRAVSNVVEKRNRAGWKLREAADNLSATMLRVLETL